MCGGRVWQVFLIQDWDGDRVKLRCRGSKLDCNGFHVINLRIGMAVS